MINNRRGLGLLLSLAAMSAIAGNKLSSGTNLYNPADDEPVKKPVPKGCKEYTFYGHTVVALNENRARKKCKRLAENERNH